MASKRTIERAKAAKRAGKSASTQAGEFVRAEIDKVHAGKHGVRNAKQAIAIGLSEARRAGVKIPAKGKAAKTKRGTQKRKPSAKRSAAAVKALKKEGSAGASHRALSKQTRAAAKKRGAKARKTSAKKAAATRKASSK
jgi:hypothetical protein